MARRSHGRPPLDQTTHDTWGGTLRHAVVIGREGATWQASWVVGAARNHSTVAVPNHGQHLANPPWKAQPPPQNPTCTLMSGPPRGRIDSSLQAIDVSQVSAWLAPPSLHTPPPTHHPQMACCSSRPDPPPSRPLRAPTTTFAPMGGCTQSTRSLDGSTAPEVSGRLRFQCGGHGWCWVVLGGAVDVLGGAGWG